MECSRCNINQQLSLECFKASNSSSQCNFLATITIALVEFNFLISNNINSQISFRYSHLKTCIHINKFNKVNNSFSRNPTFSENKQVILAKLKNKTSKKQNMSPLKQQKMEVKLNKSKLNWTNW